MTTQTIIQADCLDFFAAQPEGSIDLVFGSPPYSEARLYLENGVDLGISRKVDDWILWMVEVYAAAQRCCKGVVAFVVAGNTNDYKWNAAPALLMAELHHKGFNLRNPPLYVRDGTPGSAGPDWLKSCYEWIICTTRPGRLPWSNNVAYGDKPLYPPGGRMTNRMKNGKRVHERNFKDLGKGGHLKQGYAMPDRANPGNLIDCGAAGGSHLGNRVSHESEAPFPELLAEFMIQSFCQPEGLCADCFSGGGTVAAMAKRHNRNFVGCDLRESQVKLSQRRVGAETPMMFT